MSLIPHVFVSEPLPSEWLPGLGDQITWSCGPPGGPGSDDEFLQLLEDAEGCLLVSNDLSGRIIRQASRLRVITRFGVGYNGVDLAAATERGILVCNTPDSPVEATADLTFALLLAAARRLPEGQKYVVSGEWAQHANSFPLALEVHGRTLGIIGLGRIGRAVARRATGFGMRIIYHDLVAVPQAEAAFGARRTDLASLLRETDFVSLHVPLTEQTRGLIGKDEISRMKKEAILVNTSRGPVVDQQALYEALRDNRIAAAGLDVFELEPLPADNPLTTLANVAFTPHIGTATLATRKLMAQEAMENLRAALVAGCPKNVVNPEVLEHRVWAVGLPSGS